MICKAFLMAVNPTTHDEYTRQHDEIWPELESVLSAHGGQWDAIATTEPCRRWRGHMRDVMYSNGIVTLLMRRARTNHATVIFKRPRRRRAMRSSPRCEACDAFGLKLGPVSQ